MSLVRFHRRLCMRLGLVLACVVVLLLAAGASADPLQPIDIGSITVGNGAATASAGSDGSSANATVTVTDPSTGVTTTISIPAELVGPSALAPAVELDVHRARPRNE
jgi:hypothetical protein